MAVFEIPGVSREGLRKTTKTMSIVSCSGRNLNWVPRVYKSISFLLAPTLLVVPRSIRKRTAVVRAMGRTPECSSCTPAKYWSDGCCSAVCSQFCCHQQVDTASLCSWAWLWAWIDSLTSDVNADRVQAHVCVGCSSPIRKHDGSNAPVWVSSRCSCYRVPERTHGKEFVLQTY